MQYSIVNFNNVDLGNRIDAEYFAPRYLKEDSLLAKYIQCNIGDFAFVTDGQHGYHEVDNNSQISHLTAKNAKNWFANLEGADKIAKWVDDKNKRSSLVEGDLILSTRGTVGFCAFITEEVLPANIDQDVARIAIDDNVVIPEYVLSYLNCKFGQDWLKRNTSGMVQQGISLQKVRLLPVPLLDAKFQTNIKHTINIAYNTQTEAKLKYEEAQTLLLSELGLLDWKPKHSLSFVKNYSDAQQAERCDAEYFQPKYDEIVEAIKNYADGWDTLGNQFKQNKNKFKIENKKEYDYLEIGSINVSSGEYNTKKIIGGELPANAKISLSKDNLVVSKVRTYRGGVAIIKQNDLVGSGAFMVLSEARELKKETLFVLMKSSPYLEFSLKFNAGTSYPVIGGDDILNYPIPLIKDSIQEQIQQKITESFKLRKQSKLLLECAKKAVEIAIEEDEETAMQWMENQIDSIERDN